MSPITLDAARQAKPEALKVFGRLAQVAGVGITRIGDGYGLKVNLREPPPAGSELPGQVNGVPVRVEIVGPIRKL